MLVVDAVLWMLVGVAALIVVASIVGRVDSRTARLRPLVVPSRRARRQK
jgi:hypothetical protein